MEAMNTLIRSIHNHTENSMEVQVSGRTQKKNQFHLANEGSGLAFFGTDLGHAFGINVGKDFHVLLRGEELTSQCLFLTLSAYIVS